MYKFLVLGLSSIVLAGCFQTKTLDPNKMSYNESQGVLSIKRGVVIAVEQAEVHIDGSDDYATAGAVVGGLLGTQVGKGTGQAVAVAVGAAAGGVAGKMGSAKTVDAFVYTVELQQGGIVQVSQQGNYIPQSSKVFVKYFEEGRKTISVDQSQGVTFSTTKDTVYVD